MKRIWERDISPREDGFWERLFRRRILLSLVGVLLLGVGVGAASALFFHLFENRWVWPLHFSGIPVPASGFLSCFSSLLVNVLIGLIPLFLLGITAFGVFAVPVFLFFRGITVGMGTAFLLWQGKLPGLAWSALIYTPAAAASGVLLVLFAVRSLVFSRYLAKVSFSFQDGNLDFKCYLHDFLVFLSFSVGMSFLGCLPALLYGALN